MALGHTEVPEVFVKRIVYLSKIIGEDTSDWLVVKKMLVNALPIRLRGLLSLRHPTTLRQRVNDYDEFAINLWEDLTGVRLVIPPEKLHDPNWKPGGPPGWMLAEARERMRVKREAKKAAKNTQRSGTTGTAGS